MTRALAALIAVTLAAPPAEAVERLPTQLEGITIKEQLGRQAAIDAAFTDHNGKAVRLRDYLKDGKRPVLLTLNYYRCTTLCSIQLNILVKALRKMEWAPGENFRLVTVSIDHREKPSLARGKRKSYLDQLKRGDVDWSFLVGQEGEIRKLARSVGFGYRYDEDQDQWAHPAAAIFISPQGKIVRYIYGLEFSAQDLKFAIMEAAEGRVGSTVDRLILSCFHYDATLGRYGPFAFGIMRLGGGATVLIFGAFLAIFWRRERRKRLADRSASTEEAK